MTLSNLESLRWFAPEMVLGGGILLVLLVDLIGKRASRGLSAGLGLLTLAATAGALVATSDGVERGLFGGILARDPFADFWKVLFLLTTAVVSVIALRSKETIDYTENDREAGEFFALVLSVCLGMFIMAGASDLLMAYLSLETVSILSYVLAGYKRRDRKSSEAALKYAIYGGVASGVMLYGLSLLYGLAGSLSMAAIKQAVAVNASPTTLVIAVVMTMAGFGYKIASVPFHMWCPDVYEGAPTPITAFLSVGPKAAGFALLIRFFLGALPANVQLASADSWFGGGAWPILLGAVAVMTMTLGNFVAIVQQNIKRMLAYSSIAHAGYVLLGLVVAGPEGQQAMMFYLFAYLLMNVGAFAVVVALAEKGLGETIDDYKGLGYRAPFAAVMMAIFLFSLTGLPPTVGFAGKFLLFAAMLKQGGTLLVTLAIIAVLNSAVSLYYYARVLKAMYLDKPVTEDAVAIDRQHGVVLGVMALPILYLGLFWGPLQTWAEQSFRLWLH